MNKKIQIGSVSGWLLIIIGIIVWFASLATDVQTAFQQTVQWLGYAIASMLICTGIVCNYLGKILFTIRENSKKELAEKNVEKKEN